MNSNISTSDSTLRSRIESYVDQHKTEVLGLVMQVGRHPVKNEEPHASMHEELVAAD